MTYRLTGLFCGPRENTEGMGGRFPGLLDATAFSDTYSAIGKQLKLDESIGLVASTNT
ncbi:MAG TPA: hypothetical protein VN776_03505 [Terracidiphilus sp.]|nr:hypothetical protein [Terracidiphilus sp.]